MKLLLIFWILIFPSFLFGQDLPSNFFYQRETGEKTGIPIYHVMPRDESIAYDAIHGNTFEAVGALVQPEREKFGIVFMNAKFSFQFSTNPNKSCTLTMDGNKVEYPKYMQGIKKKVGRLYVETVMLQITEDVFNKLVDAKDVTIRCGVVIYNLDQDNTDALLYLATQMDNDLERRGKYAPK